MNRIAKPLALFLSLSIWIATVAMPSALARAAVAAEADASAPPIDINGCWTGPLTDDSQGDSTITFTFDQNGAKLRHGSRIAASSCTGPCGSYVRLGDNIVVFAPIGGAVDSTGFTFDGHFKFRASGPFRMKGLPIVCRIMGQGSLQNDGSIAGSYAYQGKCVLFGYLGGDFSLTPSCN